MVALWARRFPPSFNFPPSCHFPSPPDLSQTLVFPKIFVTPNNWQLPDLQTSEGDVQLQFCEDIFGNHPTTKEKMLTTWYDPHVWQQKNAMGAKMRSSSSDMCPCGSKKAKQMGFFAFLFLQELCKVPRLIVEGVTCDDLCEGELGNSWFVSACSALAKEPKLWHKVRATAPLLCQFWHSNF